MLRILVDADACPRSVLQICFKLANRYGLAVWTIASFNHTIESDHHIVVGNASQEADLKIMNLTEPEDIVITQDWGLAAMVLGKGAKCLSPTGREYKVSTMDFLLEEREVKAKLRRTGGRTKGPKKRSIEDDKRFEQSLHKCICSTMQNDN
jgi:uncharacterized protein YaiI (UPF0178 family)